MELDFYQQNAAVLIDPQLEALGESLLEALEPLSVLIQPSTCLCEKKTVPSQRLRQFLEHAEDVLLEASLDVLP